MNDSPKPVDLWTFPLLLLWAIFFVVGLFPSLVLDQLRVYGLIDFRHTLLTNPHFLTLACAAYLGAYTYQRCRESGLLLLGRLSRTLYVTILAVVAFLDLPMVVLLQLDFSFSSSQSNILLFIAAVKFLCWIYLYSAILRYHALGHRHVFADLLPRSSRARASTVEEQEAAEPEQNHGDTP